MSDPKKAMELLTKLIEMKQAIEALKKQEEDEALRKDCQQTGSTEEPMAEPEQEESAAQETPEYCGNNVRLGLDVYSNEDGFFIDITSLNAENGKEGVLESFKMSVAELVSMRNGIDKVLARV